MELDSLISTAEGFLTQGKQYLGRRCAGSGYRVTSCSGSSHQRHHLDWALIEVQQDRSGENEIRRLDQVHQRHRCFYAPEHKTVEGVARLKADMQLSKSDGVHARDT
jgi:hypothetical protein